MIHVLNQKGQMIDGLYREEIVVAYERGKTSVTLGGQEIEIVSAKKDKDGNLTITISV